MKFIGWLYAAAGALSVAIAAHHETGQGGSGAAAAMAALGGFMLGMLGGSQLTIWALKGRR